MKCPNKSRLAWGFLLRDHKGDELAATKAWMENNEEFPDIYLEEEALYFNDNGELLETAPKVLTVEILEKRSRFIDKSYNFLNKKLKQMLKVTNKTPQAEAVINDIKETIKQMSKYSEEESLISFLKMMNQLSRSTNKWIKDIESGKAQLTTYALKNIKDFNHATELIRDFDKDFWEEVYDESLASIVESILHLTALNKNAYKNLAQRHLADIWEPHFESYRKMYQRQLEFDFNNSDVASTLKGKELKEARDKYVQDKLVADEPYIKSKSSKYIRMMLTQFEDIDAMSSWLVNPKDINHDLLSFAVEQLDYADWLTMSSVNEKIFQMKKLVNNYFNKVGKKSNPAEQYELLTTVIEGQLYLVNEKNAKDKYNAIKTQYKNTAVEELYDALVQLSAERDKQLPMFAKLGSKIPFINKTTLERMYSTGAWNTLKEGFHDIYKLRSSDIDYGDLNSRENANKNAQSINTRTNEAGEERQNIPIWYRNPIPIEDQSHDIVSALILDYHNSSNFTNKTQASLILDILKDNIAEAQVLKRSTIKNLLKIEDNKSVSTKGIESNLYKSINDLIQHRVYGLGMDNVSPKAAKIVNKAKSYVSHVSLIGNWLSASANLLQGSTMNWIESVGGEEGNYGAKNRLNASKKYNLDLPKIMSDIGEEIPKSKTMLLMRLFNAHSDWSGLDEPFFKNNKLKRLANVGTLHGLQAITETSIQAVAMYAVLDNIKVLDEFGEYLTKDYKQTKDRNQAMSLDEAFTVIDGELVIDPRVSHTERTDDLDRGIFQISQLIRRVNRTLYGNYDSKNKSRFQRTIIGNLVTHMRGWLVSGIQYHWRGVGKYTKPLTQEQIAELSPEEKERYELNQMYNLSYNVDTGKFEEGIYTSTIKFIARVWREYKDYKKIRFSKTWRTLDPHQRRNIAKTALEALLILVALGVSSSFEDDDEYLYLAYISRRLYSELFTYANIKEGIRTFRSPAISLNTAENVVELMLQSFRPTEKYESGSHRGDYKLQHKFSKVVPIYSQLDRSTKDALNFLLK